MRGRYSLTEVGNFLFVALRAAIRNVYHNEKISKLFYAISFKYYSIFNQIL
jgi:hypothetical protein